MRKKIRVLGRIAAVLEIIAFFDILIVGASIDETPFTTCVLLFVAGIMVGIIAHIFEGVKDDYTAALKWRIRQRREIQRLSSRLDRAA